MANFRVLCLAFFISLMSSCSSSEKFIKSMYYDWGGHHAGFRSNGEDATLVLDQISGSGVQSKRSYLYGSFEMQIKLVPGNSAGTVTAFFLTSIGDNHDEIDFEFLGNVSGQPYTIHTNIFTGGYGGREQQFYPWFDPSEDFHNYTIHWNPSEVVWYVDSIPIRVYKNYESEGIPYPKTQPMKAFSSIWNADSWATRGGLDKIDWNNAPFISRLRKFRARACAYNSRVNKRRSCTASAPGNWWNAPDFSKLNAVKKRELNWVRSNYMVYDYCLDIEKYNGLMPGECLRTHF